METSKNSNVKKATKTNLKWVFAWSRAALRCKTTRSPSWSPSGPFSKARRHSKRGKFTATFNFLLDTGRLRVTRLESCHITYQIWRTRKYRKLKWAGDARHVTPEHARHWTFFSMAIGHWPSGRERIFPWFPGKNSKSNLIREYVCISHRRDTWRW